MTKENTSAIRFDRYIAMAAVPAAGVGGFAFADIFHYGGPTIRIDRAYQSGTAGDGGARYAGSSNLGLPSDFGGSNAVGVNMSMSATVASQFAFAAAKMRYGMLSNGGMSDLAFAICGSTSAGQLGGLAGSSFGNSPSGACNLLHMFQAGDDIANGVADFGAAGMVAMSASAMATAFGEVVVEQNNVVGEWAAENGEEARGFVGWSFDTADGTAYGWMNVGWNGETLSIYDWAFNTDGSIAAGQTSTSTAVPGAGGLAALAMGAAGMRRRRKKSA